MMSISEKEEILDTVVAGTSRIAQLIASVPAENRTTALQAAKRSYMQTVQDLGYGEASARKWVFAVMLQLRAEVGEMIVNRAVQNMGTR